ncbi:MAG: hypothetical protein KBE09_01505 [Candidatus Pacebacteria bacterium]|nr:hypothetical protein [Candidatus Paceibacterota bacterium]
MTPSSQRGFSTVSIIVLIAAVGAAYSIKDEQGVSYLERGYQMAHHYTIGRNQDALEQANSIRMKMQAHEDATQAAIEE